MIKLQKIYIYIALLIHTNDSFASTNNTTEINLNPAKNTTQSIQPNGSVQSTQTYNQHEIINKRLYLDKVNKEIHIIIGKIISMEKSITLWQTILSAELAILGLLIYTFKVLEI